MRILLVKKRAPRTRDVSVETFFAHTVAEALSTLNHACEFDVAIVDLDCIGEEGARLLSARHPSVQVLVTRARHQ